MPFIDEDTAFSIAQNFDQLDDTQKAKATAALQTYKATQAELGLPLFPRREREKKQTTENINSSLRDGPDSFTTHFPEYEPTFKSSPDPTGDKQAAAAMLFLADRTGMPVADVQQKLPTMMQAYSQQVWGESVTDTSTFFAKAQQQVKDEDAVRDISGEAFKLALGDAVSGKTDGVAAYAKWKTAAQGTGVFRGDQQAGDFSKVYNATAAKLKPHMELVQQVSQMLEAGMTGKPISTTVLPDQGMDPQVAAANKLMDLPPAERDIVIAAIMSKTGQQGEQADKGSKYGINPVNVVQQTGESFARTLADMYGTNELNLIQSAREGFAKSEKFTTMAGPVTSPEEARTFIREQLTNKGIEALAAMDGYKPKLGTARKLTMEESALVSKELARAERSARVVAQMGEAARSADPVKNLYASTIGSSLATLPAAMVPGGVAVLAAGYANAEDKQLALEHPEMSSGDRAKITAVSGVVMGAIDKLNVSFLADKLPSLRQLISKGVSNAVLKRAGVRMAETTVVENVAEFGQDLTTAAVQDIANKLSSDIPDVDWSSELNPEFWSGRADVAIGLLPLTLLGVGVAAANDVSGSNTMLANNKMLEQAGVLEQDRKVIVELAASNKLEESQAALREAWTRRSKEVAIANLPPEQVQAQADAAKRFAALEQAGVAPTFIKTSNGWSVRTPDGKEVQAESWAEAQQVAGQHMSDTVAREIDESAQLAQFFVDQQYKGMVETVEMAPREQGGAVTEDTSITEEQAMDRAKIGAIMAGMSPEEATRETQFILGKNITDFQGGVAESATKLFEGANVTTVVEDVVEGRIKAGLQLNRYTPAGLRKMVDMAEQATGEKFLVSDTEQGLLEAVSAIAVAEVLNIRKDGSKLPAGVVTRGMMSAVEGVAEKKEGKRLMAMMHAFRTFFRQVFSRAKALRKAKAEGKLGSDFQAFVDDLLGVDTTVKENNAVATEAMALSGVAAPTTSMATAPGKFMDAVQKKLDEELGDKPYQRVSFYEEVKKRFAKVADATNKIAAKSKDDRSKLELVQTSVRTLNAGLMGLPPKLRGKIGGALALTKATTAAAALKVIEGRLEKMGEVIEAELQQQYREQIKSTIKEGRVQGGAGDKPKSKTGADTSALFELVADAQNWDNTPQEERKEGSDTVLLVGKIDSQVAARERAILEGDLTPEQEQQLSEEIALIELVGDIANADSNRLAAISETLDTMLREGKMVERKKQQDWAAKIDSIKQQLTTATGITDIEAARAAMLKDTASLGTLSKNILLNVSSLSELMTYLFGSAAKQFIDMERKADNELHDLNTNMETKMEQFFIKLAGGDMAAQKLRYKMASEQTVKVGKEELTQNQAVHFLMTWRQPAGRKHMEGKFVDAGTGDKVQRSSWSYSQADADAVQAQLTPEAQALMDFLTGEYAAEFDIVDGLYQERYGVKLPRNPFYSPISATPSRVAMDETTDPITGRRASDVSMIPNSMRTRSTSAVNRPNFNDALQLYLNHGREINHWVAMYDFVKTMRAVFGNSEMMELVEAKGGKEAGKQLRLRIKVAVQGGISEVATNMPISKWLGGALGRVASAAILGRVSTLMIQSTQVAAASMKMPAGAFLRYQAKLMTGQLDWGAAFNSNFIKRRIQMKSPLVRAAVQDLSMAKKPGHIKSSAQILGRLLSDTDGYMTAATYNVLYHFHLDQAKAEGIADPEAYAANEAERITEEVAQPVRQANRSTFELANNSPLAKVGMAFISEGRQKLALALWAAKNAKADPTHAAKVAFYTFVINGLYVQGLKGWWALARGRDMEEVWDWKKILLESALSPITGMPGYQAFAGSTGLYESGKNALPAITRLLSGDSADDERVMRDVEAVLMGAALVSETSAALAGWSHLLGDAIRILDYLGKDE